MRSGSATERVATALPKWSCQIPKGEWRAFRGYCRCEIKMGQRRSREGRGAAGDLWVRPLHPKASLCRSREGRGERDMLRGSALAMRCRMELSGLFPFQFFLLSFSFLPVSCSLAPGVSSRATRGEDGRGRDLKRRGNGGEMAGKTDGGVGGDDGRKQEGRHGGKSGRQDDGGEMKGKMAGRVEGKAEGEKEGEAGGGK